MLRDKLLLSAGGSGVSWSTSLSVAAKTYHGANFVNGYFIVPACDGSAIYYSADGKSWNSGAALPAITISGSVPGWCGVQYVGGKYIAMPNDAFYYGNETYGAYAYSSSPGGPWSTGSLTPSSTTGWVLSNGFVSDGTGVGICIGSIQGTINYPTWFAYTTNGTSWSYYTMQTGSMLLPYGLSYGNGVWVATSESSYGGLSHPCFYSTNMSTWNSVGLPNQGGLNRFVNGYHVVIGWSWGGIIVSTNGSTWTQYTRAQLGIADTNFYPIDIVYGNGLYMIIGSYSAGTKGAYVSTNLTSGYTWLPFPSSQNAQEVAFGNGLFCAPTDAGMFFTTTGK